MRKILTSAVFVLTLAAFVAPSFAMTIKGTITKIDGENYMVKDEKGKEHKIHVNDKTKKEGDVKEGAMVSVDESKGHANSIKVETK